MVRFIPRRWSGVGAVALLAGVLAACSPGGEGGGEGGEAGESGGEGGAVAAASVAALPVAGEAGGEAGIADAYAGLDPEAAFGLRLEHLRGFVLVAREVYAGGANAGEASALVGQGVLEVYMPAEPVFEAAKATDVKAQADALVAALDAGKPAAEVEAAFKAVESALDKAAPDGSDRTITEGLLSIAAGLYEGVNTPEGVDPIEYQHSYGAALAARHALQRGKADFERTDKVRYERAVAETGKLLALWGGPVPTETPPTHGQILAQAARVELALSGL